MALTRLERNQLFEAIAASTLDPAECSLVEIGSKVLISHKRSSSTLELSEPKDFPGRYGIDYYVDDGHHYSFSRRGFEYVARILTQWAEEVKAITDAPDLWAELQRNSQELVVGIMWADTDNTPFTKDEQRQIVVELGAFTEHVKERFDLNSEQTAHIEELRDEVAEASTRLGRKDWKLLAYGAIVNLVVTNAVTPEIARHIFIVLIQGIAHIIGGSGPPQIIT